MLLWAGGAMAVLIILLVVAVKVALDSSRVHQYVLAVAKVSVRDFGLHFGGVSPVLDLYDIIISGAPPHASPALAEAQRLHVALTVTSLLHRSWYVDDVDLVQPVVRLQLDSGGGNNLPQPKSNGGQNNTSVFDLGVRHVRI
jgi:uncharacterized protein involved in outer membrane biogenesis